MKIEFEVPGVPIGKARPRVTRYRTYTPKRTVDQENLVRACWAKQSGKKMGEGPLLMFVECVFPIPSSLSMKKRKELDGMPHTKKPDADNCLKLVMDACQGYAFDKDQAVYYTTAVKVYGEEPKTRVAIYDLEGRDE